MHRPDLSRLDLNLLVVLDAVFETESVTRAAERLNISQPAVSHALSRLRTQFDDPLLVRQGQRMMLTAFAEQIKVRLRPALLGLERAMQAAEAFDPAAAHRRFVLATDNFAQMVHLPPVVEHLLAHAPNIELVVRPYSEPFERLLETGEVDLVVGTRRSEQNWVGSELRLDDVWCCVGRQNHAGLTEMTKESYQALSHIVVSPDGAGKSQVDEIIALEGFQRNIKVRVPDFVGALAMVAQSDLVLTTPSLLVEVAKEILPLTPAIFPFQIPSIKVFTSWNLGRESDPAFVWFRELSRQWPCADVTAA